MVDLLSLWKPILLSAVLVFVASSVIWMALPFLHKHDYKNPGDKEGPLLDLLRTQRFEPGVYYVPWCQGKQKDPAAMEKMKTGPWALVSVLPEGPNMGKSLGLWFAHNLIIAVVVGYVCSAAIAAAPSYLHVFRLPGTAALLAYGGYALPMSIWHGQPMRQVPGRLVDALIYALVTAGAFAWLWPTRV